jgi:hypothetical protein
MDLFDAFEDNSAAAVRPSTSFDLNADSSILGTNDSTTNFENNAREYSQNLLASMSNGATLASKNATIEEGIS